jgi:flagellin-like hook-associated protein FlgL
MELTLQQTGYEAALRATASVMQVSLMDFLR